VREKVREGERNGEMEGTNKKTKSTGGAKHDARDGNLIERYGVRV